MQEILTMEQFETTKNRDAAVFVFSADWCPDCHYLDTFFPEVMKENPRFNYYLVNYDSFSKLCEELGVIGIPSFIVYDKGKEIGRFVSKQSKPKWQVVEFLQGLS